MSVNSKHLADVPNPGQKKIELFHVRQGDQELITIEQEDEQTGLAINIVQVSLDGLNALIEELVHQRDYYRPANQGPGSNQPPLG